MRVYNKIIPEDKICQFHEILCYTGGRYISEPRRVGDIYRIDYEPGDHVREVEAWKRCCTPIKETRKPRRKKIASRLRNLFR